MTKKILLENLNNLTTDKEIFKTIVQYILYFEVISKDELLDILDISKHTLKKYLQDDYSIPNIIKTTLSLYFKLPDGIWLNYSNTFNNRFNTKFLNSDINDEYYLKGDFHVYLYNSTKKHIHKGVLSFKKDNTFTNIFPKSAVSFFAKDKTKFTNFKGNIVDRKMFITLESEYYIVTIDKKRVALLELAGIVKGLILMVTERQQEVTARRILLSKGSLKNEDIYNLLGDYYEDMYFH
jgi:hypothetical protein